MPVECVNHPGTAARGKCSECGVALCDECRITYKNRPVCEQCLENIRHKLATDAEAVFEHKETEAEIPSVDSQTATRTIDVVIAARESLEASSRPSPMRLLLLGALIGIIIGMILAMLTAKVRYLTGWPLGFTYVLAGWAIGFGVTVGAHRGGRLQGMVAAVIAFATLILGIYLFFNDSYTPKMISADEGPATIALSPGQFASMIGNVSILDWLFVLGGVAAAFFMANRTNDD